MTMNSRTSTVPAESKKYWIGQLGASFVVYSPDAEIVAFRPDLESAAKARDLLNDTLLKKETKAEGGSV